LETADLRVAARVLAEEDHHSIAGKQNNTSALSVEQERLIPREPIVLSQNKRLIALLHESRGTMDEDWRSQKRMSTASWISRVTRASWNPFSESKKTSSIDGSRSSARNSRTTLAC